MALPPHFKFFLNFYMKGKVTEKNRENVTFFRDCIVLLWLRVVTLQFPGTNWCPAVFACSDAACLQ